jgi:5-methylcytosine-specific restriction protein A
MSRNKSYINLSTAQGRNRFYNSYEWLSIRRAVLNLHPYCVECLKENIKTVATEVDHIIPLRDAPERCLDFNNLQALCKKHHSQKTYNETLRDVYKSMNTYTQVNKKWPNLHID